MKRLILLVLLMPLFLSAQILPGTIQKNGATVQGYFGSAGVIPIARYDSLQTRQLKYWQLTGDTLKSLTLSNALKINRIGLAGTGAADNSVIKWVKKFPIDNSQPFYGINSGTYFYKTSGDFNKYVIGGVFHAGVSSLNTQNWIGDSGVHNPLSAVYGQVDTEPGSSGVVSMSAVFNAVTDISGAGLSDHAGLRIWRPRYNGGAVTNLYGIYMEDMSGASGQNYALRSEGGKVYTNGENRIGSGFSLRFNNTSNTSSVGLTNIGTGVSGELSIDSKLSTSGDIASSGSVTGVTIIKSGGTVNDILLANGGVRSVSTFEVPLTFSSPLSRSVNTISIGNAAADGSTKGAAAFNATNFSASSGIINTIQNISSGSTPTFSGLNLSASAPTQDFTFSVNTNYKHSLVASSYSSTAASNELDFKVASGSGTQVTPLKLYGDNSVVLPILSGTGGAPVVADASGNLSRGTGGYSEGSWTPSATGLTLINVSGSYIKIGKLVTATFNFIVPTTSSTSTFTVTGLPAGGVGADYGSVKINYQTFASTPPTGYATGTSFTLAFNSSTPIQNVQVSGTQLQGIVTYISP